MQRFIVAVVFLSLGLAGPLRDTSVPAAETIAVEVRNPTGHELQGVPLTFGQVFPKGQFPHGVAVKSDGPLPPAQVDVRRRHDDGSVRFAVVSTVLEKLPSGTPLTLQLADGPTSRQPIAAISPSELLRTDFDAVVTLRFPDGTTRRISARQLLQQAGGQPATWLSGPIVTEWLLAGPPRDEAGKPDDDLHVRFEVRAYAGCRAVRVSVVVENCWDDWTGDVLYDASVTVGGREVFSSAAVNHRRLSRWRKVFWWGRPEPEVHLVHDLAVMSAAGALPHYDTTLELPPPSENEEKLWRMEGSRWRIMGRGALTAYMPTTGGREELAPYPEWTARYLLGMEPRAKAVVLAGGDLAGSWPIHVRARSTGRIMTIDSRPKFWLDARGEDRPQWKPPRHPPDGKAVRLTPDLAHQGSFAYVPYLVTGDFYYLEEAYFWANHCLLATWPHPRRDAEGILSGQIRGNAWSLRNMADAAWIASDGHPEAAYFDQKIHNNIADRIRRMVDSPESNKLGFWGLRTVENARIQNPADPNWMVVAPWEHDYLIWSLHHLVELGYADAARVRDVLLRWRVGMLTNSPDFDPQMATPYRMAVGRRTPEGKIVVFDDWKQIGRENARLYQPGLPGGGNGYAYSARAAVVCGVDGGFPKAAEALKCLEEMLPDHRQVMARQPYWAIVPGGAANEGIR
ncbi:MAG: hypothetical protein HQ581_11050 [Planctomycetes bacterium]|nr:hypothetical protein [Planctomycetota bacterium]